MTTLDAKDMLFDTLNEKIRSCEDGEVEILNCLGQRFIADGLSDKHLYIHGYPGNALSAYMNGAVVTVYGNAQDATGDTMNDGAIYIHGNAGDATGYAMRGGKIFVKGSIGYRAGIHMKAYREKVPKLVVGGVAGSFLGEYQAGGTIVVLGIHNPMGLPLVGRFCGTGMHGGKMFLRMEELPFDLPPQVCAKKAEAADLEEIRPLLDEYCEEYGGSTEEILNASFYVLTPNTDNPYKALYTQNN